MEIKTIVSDLDDTLLLDNHTIDNFTVKTLNKAKKMGKQVILASGRSPESMLPFIRQIGLEALYIANNGATITNAKTSEVVYNLTFKPELVRAFLHFAAEHQVYAQVYDKGFFYYSTENTGINEVYATVTNLQGKYMENIATKWNKDTSKVVMIMDEEMVPILWEKALNQFGEQVSITTSKPTFLEFTPPKATKGDALAWLEEEGMLSAETTMAFGDSMNDLTMLTWSKYSVAIGNARDEIKSITKYIAPTNNENGVAKTVEKFIIKGEKWLG